MAASLGYHPIEQQTVKQMLPPQPLTDRQRKQQGEAERPRRHYQLAEECLEHAPPPIARPAVRASLSGPGGRRSAPARSWECLSPLPTLALRCRHRPTTNRRTTTKWLGRDCGHGGLSVGRRPNDWLGFRDFSRFRDRFRDIDRGFRDSRRRKQATARQLAERVALIKCHPQPFPRLSARPDA